MDGTDDAFRTVCRAHARHGTTSLLPTTTVARHEQHLAFLDAVPPVCKREGTGGARILGAHFYGPYFAYEARGCHPGAAVRPPVPAEYEQYLAFADCIATATVAPELPGAEGFVRACRARGIRCNAGHSHATFEQMEAAVGWGVRHVDHLFCAMSDRARLRQTQTYPMRGGVMEATLYFDELTTEVIADGKHLQRELLLLAYKIKGPDRLALVTDCNRALDMPDGEYMFGPLDGGEPILQRDGVGVMPDGTVAGLRRRRHGPLRPHVPPADRRAAAGGGAHGQPDAGPHRRLRPRDRQHRAGQAGRPAGAGRGAGGAGRSTSTDPPGQPAGRVESWGTTWPATARPPNLPIAAPAPRYRPFHPFHHHGNGVLAIAFSL